MTEIGAVETHSAVRTYSRPPARAATYDGDVDRAGEARGPKPPEPSGSVVAQDRTGSADEERGQFQRERRGDRMTDQEHARMHSVQPPAGDPPTRRGTADAGFEQLMPGDQPALLSGHVRDAQIDGTSPTPDPAHAHRSRGVPLSGSHCTRSVLGADRPR